ncbi:MAG: hypothetical protein ACYS5V_04435 [Planctomycetota bacterium]
MLTERETIRSGLAKSISRTRDDLSRPSRPPVGAVAVEGGLVCGRAGSACEPRSMLRVVRGYVRT